MPSASEVGRSDIGAPTAGSWRGGFTMVEVIVALLILTVGVLGLAGTTGLVVSQVTIAKVRSDRANAVQSVLEQVRATDYGDLAAGSDTVGGYSVSWTVTPVGSSTLVSIVSEGPGLASSTGHLGRIGTAVVDTFTYRRIRP